MLFVQIILVNLPYISWPFFWVAHCDDLRLSRPEAATVGCCRRQQHLWSHRNPYSRPEAAIISCGRRPQDFLSHMSRPKSGLWSLYDWCNQFTPTWLHTNYENKIKHFFKCMVNKYNKPGLREPWHSTVYFVIFNCL